MRVLRSPRRNAPAPWFGLKFNANTARWTRARVWGDTLASSLITRDTVLVPTPANAATSRIVARHSGPIRKAELTSMSPFHGQPTHI